MQSISPPKKRSKYRLYCGAVYFRLKRRLMWLSGKLRFAKVSGDPLPYTVFNHATPLLRKLKDVDMYLQYNKITNLKLAVEKVNGAVILPGETFSFWKLVGKPSKRKGYLEGMNLRSGTVVPAIGGGMCQLTNLIYWMTLHTPLTVTERHRHSYDVFPDSNRTQPFGSGATCFYNYGDLMIRNDTGNVWRLVLEVTENELTGAWTCAVPSSLTYEVFEKASFIQLETWGGYTRNNVLFRKVIDNANPGGDWEEYITENHALMMYAPLLDDGSKIDCSKN